MTQCDSTALTMVHTKPPYINPEAPIQNPCAGDRIVFWTLDHWTFETSSFF